MLKKQKEKVLKSSEEIEKEILQNFAKRGIKVTQEELDELSFEKSEYIRVESK